MSFSVSYKKFVGFEGSQYSTGFSELRNMSMLAEIVTTCVWSPIVWEQGARNSKHFAHASFMVLDFDEPGDESMADVNNALSDHKRIIALTKSHMKQKNGVICERYRLVIPFNNVITDLNLYKHNMDCALKKYPWADQACKDGARFFYPCSKIVYVDRMAEYSWDTLKLVPPSIGSKSPILSGKEIPLWCLNFLNYGSLCKNKSRNLTVYAVCFELFSRGYSEVKVEEVVKRAPIDWHGVNLSAALKDSKGKVT